MKGCRLLKILGHPDPWRLTPAQVFFDLELLREDRRRERVHDANAMRASNAEIPQEAFQEFLTLTP